MRVLLTAIFLIVWMSACRVTEKSLPGTYRLPTSSRTMLELNPDKSFEFVKNFSQPGPPFFPDSTEFNFRTRGRWELSPERQLVLNSTGTGEELFPLHVKDSSSNPTSLSSFSFWDRYGDPVEIRLIRFPGNRAKLHKGNLITFFSQDFNPNDTLEFQFYGYPPYRWILGDPGPGNNREHRVTLYEEYRPLYFNRQVLLTGKKKLSSPDRSFTLFKIE